MGCKTALRILVLLCVAGLGVACTRDDGDVPGETVGDGPYRIVASVGMVGDIVGNVAGDTAEVSVIMGPGVDPHLYTPTRDDVARMLGADAIFYVGLLLEGRMVDALIAVGRSKPVYAVTQLIDDEHLIEAQGHYDPHVWMDVSAWSQAVEAVAQALAEFDPANADDYRRNAEHYQQKLAALHDYGLERIATIPAEAGAEPILITSHDAFNYFGKAYGLEVLGIQGLSTVSEAGLQRINELIDLIVANEVPAVFIESTVSPQNIQALIEGARARGHAIEIGGELYSDAMGPSGNYEGTYIGMLDHNITVVTQGLGGEAPVRGMQGKLSLPEDGQS
ncbi:MAG: zinc ABC transporter substrate-binding protein [Thiotrichales bacterium]|nr:zinc ABC transporter substrate-binding protein [Thiotrichales bacterium]